MIDESLLADWLSAVPTVLTIKFVVGPYRPEFGKADTIGVVSGTPGPGLLDDGLWNGSGFQVMLEGRDRDHAKLKQAAFDIDHALIFGDYPASLWGTWVRSVDRTGGEPSPQQADEHQRQQYFCTYFAEVSP
jgi:hypothetical protein